MATNLKHAEGRHLAYAPTALTPSSGVASGDPVLVGVRPGIAEAINESTITVDHGGVYTLEVVGAGPSGNVAIPVGGAVYYDSGEINGDATNGAFFGWTTEAVASGATASVGVKVAGM